MGKAQHTPPPMSIYLFLLYFFSLCLCFDLSRRGLTGAFTHLYFLRAHTHIGLSGVSPEWLGYGGMCHSSIIDQIQLLSSTDHLEIHHCLCLMQTRSHFHTHANLPFHSLKCPLFPPFLTHLNKPQVPPQCVSVSSRNNSQIMF